MKMENRINWKKFIIAAILVATQILGPGALWANLPSGESVQSGNASFLRVGTNLDINASSKVIIDWADFSVGNGYSTDFSHSGPGGASLNRVLGGNVSQLHGTLTSNGSIYLINPNGVLVGPDGIVQTQGSFVASTLDITNSEFLAGGDLNFSGNSATTVINLGTVTALDGDVILIARQVENTGNLHAANGTVGLAAGNEVLLKASGVERIFVQTGSEHIVSGDGVVNSGSVDAINAELKAAGNLYALAINSTGSVNATGAAIGGGRVLLVGDGDVAVNGSVSSDGGAIDIEFGRADGTGNARLGGTLDTGDINVDVLVTGNADDSTLTLDDLDKGLLPLGHSLSYNGGDGFDDLVLSDGDFSSVAYHLYNPNDGHIDIDGVTINFAAIEPITSTITAANVILSYSTTAETVTVSDAGGGQNTVSSTAGELVTFNNPSTSLQINVDGGGGADIINVEGLNSAFNANFTINGDSGDTVNFQTNPTDVGSGDVTITAAAINFNQQLTSSNGDFAFTADNISIAQALESSGKLTIAPLTTSATIGIGDGSTGTLNLDASEITNLTNGFNTITIGDSTAGTGAVDITGATFNDKVRIYGGSITVTGLNAGNNHAYLEARTGAIVDGDTDTTTDVKSNHLTLKSVTGIGSGANPLDADVSFFSTEVSGTGDLNMRFASAVEVDNTTFGVTGITVNDGSLTMEVLGKIEIDKGITSSGDLSLTSTGASNDVHIENNIEVKSTGGNVSIFAGDDLRIDSGAKLTSTSGSITVNIDATADSNEDNATFRLDGTATASTGITINGGNDDDFFFINSNLNANLNGNAGEDLFAMDVDINTFTGLIDGGADDDTIEIEPEVTVTPTGAGTVDGNQGTLDSTPDIFTNPSNPFDFDNIEIIELDSDTPVFAGLNAPSTWTYSKDGLRYQTGGISLLLTGVTTINAGSGDDVLTLDFTDAGSGEEEDGGGGGLAFPGELTFNADGGNDTINLLGTLDIDDITYSFTNANDGDIVFTIEADFPEIDIDLPNLFSLPFELTYTGLEPIIDNLSSSTRQFQFNGGTETIDLTNAATAGRSFIDSNLGESVEFANPTTSVRIDAGTGDDTINVTGMDTAYTGALIINGDAGTNTVDLALPGVSLSALRVDTGTGAITDSGTITVTGAASFDSGTDTTNLNVTTNTYGTLGVIADSAVIREADDTNLTGLTITNSLTLNSTGQIFDEAGATLTVGGSAVLTAGGRDITLGDAGATVSFARMSITNNVSNGRVTLTHTGAILLDAITIANNLTLSTVSGSDPVSNSGLANIIVGDDLIISGAGAVTLDRVGNSFDRVQLDSVGTSVIDDTADGDPILFDIVGGNSITGDFTVTSSGDIRGRQTTVTGSSTFDAGTNDVSWTTQISMPKFAVTNARNVLVSGGLIPMTLGPSNITDDFTLFTVGAIDACGAVVNGGLTTFSVGGSNDITLNAHNHEFADLLVITAQDVDILDTSGGLFIGDRFQQENFAVRNLTISTRGPLHDTGRIRVGQTLDVRNLVSPLGAEIKLDFVDNHFGNLIVQSFLDDGVTPALGRLTIKQRNSARVTTIQTTREFNLTSQNAITFENTNPLEFPIMRLDAQNTISQQGGTFLTTDQVYITTAQNPSNVTLNQIGNDFDRIIFHPVSVNNVNNFTLSDDDGIQIIGGRVIGNATLTTGGDTSFDISTGGTLDITAAGSIRQTSPLTIGGNATITSTVAGSDIDLFGGGGTNNFNGANGVVITAPSVNDFNLRMNGQNFTLQVAPGTPLTDYNSFELILPTLTGPLSLPSLNITGDSLIDTAGDNVLQAPGSTIVVGGTAAFRVTDSANLFLTGSNDFSQIEINSPTTPTQALNVFVTDINDIKVIADVANNLTINGGGDVNFSVLAGNDVSVNTSGSISQVGTINVGNNVTVNSTGSGVDVTLDGFGGGGNTIGNLFSVGTVNAVIRHLKLNANVVSPALTIAPTRYRSVSLTFPNGAIDLPELNVSDSLTVNVGGNITQSAELIVAGTATFNVGAGNDLTLDNANNNFNRLVVAGASGNPGANNLTVNDVDNIIVTADIANDVDITSANGQASIAVEAGGSLTVSADSIVQNGLTSSVGAAIFNVDGGALAGDLTLNGVSGVGNIFGGGATVNATGNTMRNLTYLGSGAGSNLTITATNLANVSLSVDSAIALSGMTLSGNLNVTSIGNITQGGILTVAGDANFNAGGAGFNVQLTQNNDFNRLSANNANNVTVTESNNITIFNSNIVGQFLVTAGGNISVIEPVTAGGGRNF